MLTTSSIKEWEIHWEMPAHMESFPSKPANRTPKLVIGNTPAKEHEQPNRNQEKQDQNSGLFLLGLIIGWRTGMSCDAMGCRLGGGGWGVWFEKIYGGAKILVTSAYTKKLDLVIYCYLFRRPRDCIIRHIYIIPMNGGEIEKGLIGNVWIDYIYILEIGINSYRIPLPPLQKIPNPPPFPSQTSENPARKSSNCLSCLWPHQPGGGWARWFDSAGIDSTEKCKWSGSMKEYSRKGGKIPSLQD